jgi:hypothetical protein
MWQVVSGTANLLSDRALQAVVPTMLATVVVAVPGQAEPWQVANAAFRLFMDDERQIDPPGEAMPLIVRGQMYGCLDLTEMDTLRPDDVDVVLAESARAPSSPQARRATSRGRVGGRADRATWRPGDVDGGLDAE